MKDYNITGYKGRLFSTINTSWGVINEIDAILIAHKGFSMTEITLESLRSQCQEVLDFAYYIGLLRRDVRIKFHRKVVGYIDRHRMFYKNLSKAWTASVTAIYDPYSFNMKMVHGTRKIRVAHLTPGDPDDFNDSPIGSLL